MSSITSELHNSIYRFTQKIYLRRVLHLDKQNQSLIPAVRPTETHPKDILPIQGAVLSLESAANLEKSTKGTNDHLLV